MSALTINWKHLDTLESPDSHIAYLELAQKSHTFKLVRAAACEPLECIREGVGVDVGCGLGLSAYELNMQGWETTGIDLSHILINEARRRYPDLNYHVGDALNLPFDDASLDFYRAERLYHHLSKQQIELALAEAYRVLKPGGKIVLVEPDYETITFTCSDANRPLARMAVEALTEIIPNGRLGSCLRGFIRKSGFTKVHSSGHAYIFNDLKLGNPILIDVVLNAALEKGCLNDDQVKKLRKDIAEYELQDGFQASCTAFITSASKP